MKFDRKADNSIVPKLGGNCRVTARKLSKIRRTDNIIFNQVIDKAIRFGTEVHN